MTAIAGVDLLVLGAFALLAGGVVGSVVPGLPGAVLSLAGVYAYWWHTGYADPGSIVLVALTIAAVAAIAFDWVGGAVATRAGGGSAQSTAAAGLVGGLLFVVAGPLGVLAGVAGTVFVVEYWKYGSASGSLRTAAYATAGVLASAVVQLVVTASILLAMVLVVLF
jgi:uncharacterized protein YqgC (DUF456 family)